MNQGGKVCKFFLSGNCIKGNNCPFEHSGGMGNTQMSTNPGYEKPHQSQAAPRGSICNYFLQGTCNKQKCQ
jgi:hypothetical protein